MVIFTLHVGKHKARFMEKDNGTLVVIGRNGRRFYFSTLDSAIQFIKEKC